MAIYSINNINQLKHIALKINKDRTICYVECIDVGEVYIGVSLQVSIGIYKKNNPGSYYADEDVLVFIVDNENIFVLPYCQSFEDILIQENYEWDKNIYIPTVTTESLERITDKGKWMIALNLCNM